MSTQTTNETPQALKADVPLPFERPGRRRLWIVFRVAALVVIVAFSVTVYSLWKSYGPHVGAVVYFLALGADVQSNWDPDGWRNGIYTTVNFSRSVLSEVKDDDLPQLSRLKRLEVLDLTNCESVTDVGLDVLARLPDLKELSLKRRVYANYDARITDAGLARLKNMTRLERLSLSGTAVSDAGLANLKGLKRLEDLDLRSTRVTDRGLVHLKGLSRLKSLDVRGTKMTPQGTEALRQALPDLEILEGPIKEQ